MSARDDGGPADRMTLRDYFAGQAMMGLMASPATDDLKITAIARKAFIAADAMLAARKEPTP